MAKVRQQPANDDICAVLAHLLGPRRFDAGRAAANADAPRDAVPCADAIIDAATLDAFRLDHAHHADRLPLLLRELASPRAA